MQNIFALIGGNDMFAIFLVISLGLGTAFYTGTLPADPVQTPVDSHMDEFHP